MLASLFFFWLFACVLLLFEVNIFYLSKKPEKVFCDEKGMIQCPLAPFPFIQILEHSRYKKWHRTKFQFIITSLNYLFEGLQKTSYWHECHSQDSANNDNFNNEKTQNPLF